MANIGAPHGACGQPQTTHRATTAPPQVLGTALGAIIVWALFLSIYHLEAHQKQHALRQARRHIIHTTWLVGGALLVCTYKTRNTALPHTMHNHQGKRRGLAFQYIHALLGAALNTMGAGLLMALETYDHGPSGGASDHPRHVSGCSCLRIFWSRAS